MNANEVAAFMAGQNLLELAIWTPEEIAAQARTVYMNKDQVAQDELRAGIHARALVEGDRYLRVNNLRSLKLRERFVEGFKQGVRTLHAQAIEKDADYAAFTRNRMVEWWFDRNTDSADLDRFKTRFEASPFDAFEWGTDAVKAAARVHFAKQLQAVVAEHGIDAALNIAREEVLRGARFGHHSTSPMSNLCAEFKLAVYADFVSEVK